MDCPTLFSQFLLSNCCPRVLIMFGKCDTCADEEPKYKEKRDVLSVRESEG